MPTLLILRHAKSSWDDTSLDDHARALNKRGRTAAATIGRFMKQTRMLPDVVLVSSAVRAQETVKIWKERASYTGPIETKQELYLAPPDVYIACLKTLPSQVERAMVVGHNPGLEQLVTTLTGAHESLPTAALAQIRIGGSTFGAAEMKGELVKIWRVKELAE